MNRDVAGGDVTGRDLRGAATPSPNIWGSPQVYELLNRAADPEGLIARALDEAIGDGVEVLATPAAPPSGVARGEVARPGLELAVDIGCGTGFPLPMLARRARRVVGVEPHPGLAALARRRVARARLADRVDVRGGLAERLPLEPHTADLVYSHWAYFFGPGCEPGMREAERVLRPGGLQVAVDLDVSATHGYSTWFAASGAGVRADRSSTFFVEHGWQERRLPLVWSFERRSDLEAVLRIEFPPGVAARARSETVGTTIAVPTLLRWRRLT
jgi:SAM-dependent methyltransferase